MELITERLILREFNQHDWPAVLAYQSDPRYLRYYPWTGRTPKDAQEFVQMFLDQQHEQPRIKFQLAIILKPDRQLIGNCGIRLESPGAHQGDIGYELSPNHWGRGYATEAAGAILQFGFTQLNLHRIWSWCMAENRGSARVLGKLGMRLEGRLRENEYFKDRWWDTLMFGMLKSDWQPQGQMVIS
jgi:RimJ/RimL family protein N-acetyltransferase